MRVVFLSLLVMSCDRLWVQPLHLVDSPSHCLCLICINCPFKMLMCLIVEDLLALEFSIKYSKIVGISLSPLKYIYGFSVVGCLLATLDAAAMNSKKKSHRCLSSEPQSPLRVPCPCWVRVVPMGGALSPAPSAALAGWRGSSCRHKPGRLVCLLRRKR